MAASRPRQRGVRSWPAPMCSSQGPRSSRTVRRNTRPTSRGCAADVSNDEPTRHWPPLALLTEFLLALANWIVRPLRVLWRRSWFYRQLLQGRMPDRILFYPFDALPRRLEDADAVLRGRFRSATIPSTSMRARFLTRRRHLAPGNSRSTNSRGWRHWRRRVANLR